MFRSANHLFTVMFALYSFRKAIPSTIVAPVVAGISIFVPSAMKSEHTALESTTCWQNGTLNLSFSHEFLNIRAYP